MKKKVFLFIACTVSSDARNTFYYLPNILKVTPTSKCSHPYIFEHILSATVAKRQSRRCYTQNLIWNSVYHINLPIFLFSTSLLSLKSVFN